MSNQKVKCYEVLDSAGYLIFKIKDENHAIDYASRNGGYIVNKIVEIPKEEDYLGVARIVEIEVWRRGDV